MKNYGVQSRQVLEDAAWTGSGWAVEVLQEAELVVAYGVNDCEGSVLGLPLARVIDMLRPAESRLEPVGTGSEWT